MLPILILVTATSANGPKCSLHAGPESEGPRTVVQDGVALADFVPSTSEPVHQPQIEKLCKDWPGASEGYHGKPVPTLTSDFDAGRFDLEKKTYSFGSFMGYDVEWTNWLSEEFRGSVRFEYHSYYDCGNEKRKNGFSKDREVDPKYQQSNGKTYEPLCSAEGPSSCVRYDRGHQVPANHFDHVKDAIYKTNSMTNILPQVDEMNRGAWKDTEMVIQCYRDLGPLHVLGGAVFRSDNATLTARDAFFQESHHLPVNPHAFWKVITRVAPTVETIAFWLPNAKLGMSADAADFIVSIADLEERLRDHGSAPEQFGLPQDRKDEVVAFWEYSRRKGNHNVPDGIRTGCS